MKREVNPPNVWRTKLITLAFILAVAAPAHQAIGYYQIIDLGTLNGCPSSNAYSINNHGQIVGWSQDSLKNERATLFDPTGGGKNIDLNTLIDPGLGWTLRSAHSINDNGWIVGVGWSTPGYYYERAYLLIPEPASAAIMVLGATLIASKRRR